MAAQLDYGYTTPKGLAGGLFDISYHEVVTRMNDEEDGKMGFGVAVIKGENAGQSIKLPVSASTAANFDGITINEVTVEQDMKGKAVIKNGVSLGVIRKGKVWAKTADGCVPAYGATAYVVTSGDEAGYFTSVADGAVDIGVKFGTESDDGIAVVEIK